MIFQWLHYKLLVFQPLVQTFQLSKKAGMVYPSFKLLSSEAGPRHLTLFGNFILICYCNGIHLKTKQKAQRVSEMQTLPNINSLSTHLFCDKVKTWGHSHCLHLNDKILFPLKVWIWRNETCWQIHHNLAMLFSYF